MKRKMLKKLKKLTKILKNTIILFTNFLLFEVTPAFASVDEAVKQPIISPELKKIMLEVFGLGGQCFPITLLIVVCLVSWIYEMVAKILGKNNFAGIIKQLADIFGISIFAFRAIAIVSAILAMVL